MTVQAGNSGRWYLRRWTTSIASRRQILPLLILMGMSQLNGQGKALSCTLENEGLLVMEGADSVLFYQRQTTALQGAYPRAHYIHPLYGLDGAVLTEDFPQDHPHHRGVFWAWHQVRVSGRLLGDPWECRDFNWEVTDVHVENRDSSLVLGINTFWKSPHYTADGDQVPVVNEYTEITVHQKAQHYRRLDFNISLLALCPNLTLGGSDDEKGYGGFSIRLTLPEDVRFSSSEGAIRPADEAVEADTWMKITGSLGKDGGEAGIVIISRNERERGKTKWILRSKKSMQNAVYPGRVPVAVSQTTPTELRYTLIIFDGPLSPSALALISGK